MDLIRPTERVKPQAVIDRPPTRETHVKEMYGLSPDWRCWKWEVIGPIKKPFGINLTGGIVTKKIARGKRKGQWNYRAVDPATVCTLTVSDAAHQVWLRLWEQETGFCFECEGTGQRWSGWSAADGTKWLPCKRCDATGAGKRSAA